LRTTHRSEDEREGDERADADHVEHVERDRRAQGETAVQLRLGLGCGIEGWV
jgi:hypothetical protein